MAITLQLILILIVLFIFNFISILKKKWVSVFVVFFALLLFCPVEIQGIFSNKLYSIPGELNLSLVGYDSILIILCTIMTKQKFCDKGFTIKKLSMIIILFLLMFVMRLLFDGVDCFSNKMFDNYLLPVLIAIIMIGKVDECQLKKILNVVFCFIFFNAIIASFEFFLGKSLFFHDYYYNNINWYKVIYDSTKYGVYFRSTSLLSHPLTNGLYFSIALVYLLSTNYKNLKIKHYVETLILLFAIFSTNSRICMFITILYLLYFSIKYKKANFIFTFVIVGLIMLLKGNLNDLYLRVFSRDIDGSSLNVRIMAIQSLSKIDGLILLGGTGYNNTYGLLKSLGFVNNVEISYLIILLENGIIGFVSYLAILYTLYGYGKKRKITNHYISISNQAIIVFMLIALTSNSIADPGTLNYMLTFVLCCHCIIGKKKEEAYGKN